MISINSVYTAVQTILNKDNRGMLTPDDFNNIVKVSFYNILDEVKIEADEGMNKLHKGKADGDSLQYIRETLDIFYTVATISQTNGEYSKPNDFDYLDGLYNGDVQITQASVKESKLLANILHMDPSDTAPVFIEVNDKYEVISDTIDGDIDIYYYRLAADPIWTYDVIAGQIVYDGSNASKQDIELSNNYFNRVVLDVLFYAGMNIRDPEVTKALLEDKTADNIGNYRDKILNR